MPTRSIDWPSSRPSPAAPGLVLLTADVPGVAVTSQPAFDPPVPMSALELAEVDAPVAGVAEGPVAAALLRRLALTGGLLAAAEAVGAAGRLLDDARRYATERRQFGRTIGSYQALRHILADMYVRQASMWSTVLYAAAALDDDLDEPARPPRSRRHTSRAARARSRTARCRSSEASPSPRSTPRTASCAGSSCASSSSGTPPITSARSGGRSRPGRPPAAARLARGLGTDGDDTDG